MAVELKNFNEELHEFGRYVQQQARTRLTKAKKRASGELYNATRYKLKEGNNLTLISFVSTEYAKFVDQGVKGKESSKKAPNSPFRFGTGNYAGSGEDWKKRIDEWIDRKGLKLRDSKGRFAKGGKKTLNFLIRRKLYKEGIAPTDFFTTPFERGIKRLPSDLERALAEDIRNEIQNISQRAKNNGLTN